ncbi:hypothetical protein [Sediminicoccus sp. BL-A-41-H5]|uniref:hypothetical protein n=1 Tax=Sediminicoccus sp. BL-A-41-H5 TaxID=3421106 RepID=UPI003D669C9C
MMGTFKVSANLIDTLRDQRIGAAFWGEVFDLKRAPAKGDLVHFPELKKFGFDVLLEVKRVTWTLQPEIAGYDCMIDVSIEKTSDEIE